MINITLYTFSKRVNSTKRPSGSGTSVSALLKTPTSLISPSFTLAGDYDGYNYLVWSGRYYYINNRVYENATMVTLECSMDVLATCKDDILNTNAFIKYAASNYDPWIDDARLSQNGSVDVYASDGQLITDGVSGLEAGTFILQYVTSQPTYGPGGCVYLTASQCASVAAVLSSPAYMDFLDSATKQLQGAYDSLISCKYIPTTWAAGGSAASVVLAGYDTGISAIKASTIKEYFLALDIPWPFNDFRRSSKYVSMLLFLPGYGWLELNASDWTDYTTIPIKLIVDGVTGTATYIIGEVARCEAQFASDIGIGTLAGNAISLLGSVGGSVGLAALASSGIGAFISGAASFLAGTLGSLSRNVGTSGGSGGAGSLIASPNDFTRCYLKMLVHDTTVDPSSVANTIGRPYCRSANIGSFSGYVQTVDASVSTSYDNEVTDTINQFLNGGVFIE